MWSLDADEACDEPCGYAGVYTDQKTLLGLTF